METAADIDLTKSQEQLLPKFKAFLDGPEKFFLLTGKPGVGKTFITKLLLKAYIDADRENGGHGMDINVAGICLAHQAKNVLGVHIPRVFTFAKAYGLKEHTDDYTGKRTFVYDKFHDGVIIGDQPIPVFVHDEVSQYTEEMLEIVFSRTSMFSKIIFIGDRAQLPPIDPENKLGKDADSPIFMYDIPDNCKHELTERVRQEEGNKILQLSDVIREEIFGLQRVGLVREAMAKPQMEGGMGYDWVTKSELMFDLERRNVLDTKVIAHTNDAVNRHNPDIRNFLMQNPDNFLVEDDIVAMTDSFYSMDEFGFVKYVLFNSEVFRIKEIYTTVIQYEAFSKKYKIDAMVANIENKVGQFIIPSEYGYELLQEYLREIADACKSHRNWGPFWDFRKKFCEWTYGYATTCYKAQGGTYETVYVDVNDIFGCRPLSRKRQLQTVYTAITRAKKDVYFIK